MNQRVSVRRRRRLWICSRVIRIGGMILQATVNTEKQISPNQIVYEEAPSPIRVCILNRAREFLQISRQLEPHLIITGEDFNNIKWWYSK